MNKRRNASLDILKGLSALFVIITHYKWTNSQRLCLLFPFWIDMAVPVFMLITGYVYSISFLRQHIEKYFEAYHPTVLWKRAERLLFPYVVVFIVETVGRALSGQSVPFFWIIKTFITGGIGPGSYYTPVMFQVILLFPLVFFVVKRMGTTGVLVWGG